MSQPPIWHLDWLSLLCAQHTHTDKDHATCDRPHLCTLHTGDTT